MRLRWFHCGLLVVLCCPRGASAGFDPPLQIALRYEVTLDGLPVASTQERTSYDGSGYVIEADTRTRGLLDAIVGFRSKAETVAALSEGNLLPISHDVENKWRGKHRHVHLRYAKGAITETDVFPSAEGEDRELVPDNERIGTVDPITGALQMMLAAQSGPGCAQHIQVFDGRRRYDFQCNDTASSDPQSDFTRWRRVYTFEELHGRQRHPFWPPSKYPRRFAVWFARLDPRLPPVIVKVVARAGIARLRIRLAEISIDGEEVVNIP